MENDKKKYQQVLASVREVGVIEPLIVFPQIGNSGMYVLLDGHVRVEVLKQIGQTHARCLIATDDETYTYNKRVNQLTPNSGTRHDFEGHQGRCLRGKNSESVERRRCQHPPENVIS